MATRFIAKHGLKSNINRLTLSEGEIAIAYNDDRTTAEIYSGSKDGTPILLVPEVDVAELLANAQEYTNTKISELVDGAPEAMDTLKELADAISKNSDIMSALQSAIGNKANVADLNTHTSDTSNPHGVTKEQVGLGNVDNTSDIDKPVSTATQEALDGKSPKNHAAAGFLYGKGTGTLHGHVRLSDSVTSSVATSDKGIAATPYAVKTAYDKAVEGVNAAEKAQETADGKLDANFVSNGYAGIDEVTARLNGIEEGAEVNKVTSVQGRKGDVTITKSDLDLDNVENVSTNEQTPTFTEASTRVNIASGETLSTLFGKIKKFFTDLKTVAFTGSYTDLSNKPTTATTSTSGFMSASDKTKLNGIATGANNYTHPSTHPASMIVQDSTHRFVSDNEISDWDSKLGAQDEIYNGWTLWDVAESVSDFSNAFNTNSFAGAGEIVEKLADAMRSATIVVGASNSKYHSANIHSVDYECTGTNDQTVIQQAIDALPSTGGRIVLLEGTYNISGTITIKKQNVTLQGLGRNVILKMATSTSNVNMFDISSATGLVISDIAIDCANNTGGGSTAIKLYSSDHVIIERVNITNAKGNGVEWFNCNYTRFSDVSFINVGQCVWDRGSNHSSTFGNTVIDTVTNGIVLIASSTLNKIFDCIVRKATDCGIKSDAAYTMINDNIVYGCGVGITANGNCSTVSGNNARDNNTGISVNGKMVNVSGNTALRADGSGNVSSYSSSQYTILMGSSSANCLVIGNIISGKNYTNNGASTNTFANNKY